MTIDLGWPVALALILLMAITLLAHRASGFGLGRSALVAGLRACLQLGIAAAVISSVIASLQLSIALAAVMFAMAVLTTCRRVEAPTSWPWAAAAMAGGSCRLAVVLATHAVPLKGVAIIPIAGIVIGNAMTAHTLAGRRTFAALREEHSQYEACLSLGLLPSQGISEIVHRRTPEALLPGSTRSRPPVW